MCPIGCPARDGGGFYRRFINLCKFRRQSGPDEIAKSGYDQPANRRNDLKSFALSGIDWRPTWPWTPAYWPPEALWKKLYESRIRSKPFSCAGNKGSLRFEGLTVPAEPEYCQSP